MKAQHSREPIGFRCRRNDGLGEWSYVYHREPDDFERKYLVIERIFAESPAPLIKCMACDGSGRMHEPGEEPGDCSLCLGTGLIVAPPAPVAVPDEQHSERFDWSYEDWANHLGGRHQNNDPACYYEFGSFMAVAEMLRQFGNVQRKVGWNACRTAMLKAEPVTAAWIAEAKKLAELHRISFVIFRNGEQPVCADPTKFWFGFDPAAPEQEV